MWRRYCMYEWSVVDAVFLFVKTKGLLAGESNPALPRSDDGGFRQWQAGVGAVEDCYTDRYTSQDLMREGKNAVLNTAIASYRERVDRQLQRLHLFIWIFEFWSRRFRTNTPSEATPRSGTATIMRQLQELVVAFIVQRYRVSSAGRFF